MSSKIRTANFKKSVISGVIGKFSSILLQVVSMPMAAYSLGNDGFAAYSIIASLLVWLGLSNLGVGPALVVKTSAALGAGDIQRVKALIRAAQKIILGMSTLVLVVFFLLIFSFDIESLLFSKVENVSSQELKIALVVVVITFFFMINLSVIESVQIARQETHVLNKFIAVGLLLSGVVVYLVSIHAPSVLLIIIAVNFPALMFRFVNAYRFCERNKNFFWCDISVLMYSDILNDGVKFSVSGALNNFVSHFFPIIAFGMVYSVEKTAALSAVVNALIIFSSFYSLTTVPLSGALPEAKAKNDVNWIKNTYYKLALVNGLYSLVVCFVLYFFGEFVFNVWYRGSVAPSQDLLLSAGIYFVLLGLEVTNFSFLSSVGYLAFATKFLILKSIVYGGLVVFVVMHHSDVSPFYLLFIVTFSLSTLPLSIRSLSFVKGIK